MKITIDGHGGHCCEAHSGKNTEIGYTIEEAIGRLIAKHPEEFGIEIEILDCETSAYDRSSIMAAGETMKVEVNPNPPYEEPELTPEESREFAELQSLMTSEYLSELAKTRRPQASWLEEDCVYPF